MAETISEKFKEQGQQLAGYFTKKYDQLAAYASQGTYQQLTALTIGVLSGSAALLLLFGVATPFVYVVAGAYGAYAGYNLVKQNMQPGTITSVLSKLAIVVGCGVTVYACKIPLLAVVLCGSAALWLTDNTTPAAEAEPGLMKRLEQSWERFNAFYKVSAVIGLIGIILGSGHAPIASLAVMLPTAHYLYNWASQDSGIIGVLKGVGAIIGFFPLLTIVMAVTQIPLVGAYCMWSLFDANNPESAEARDARLAAASKANDAGKGVVVHKVDDNNSLNTDDSPADSKPATVAQQTQDGVPTPVATGSKVGSGGAGAAAVGAEPKV